MTKPGHNFGYFIPELRETIVQYGCKLSEKPPYVLLGQYNSKAKGPTLGILCAANNEFHAHLLRREICKSGYCEIQKTEYFPEPKESTFSIQDYMKQMRTRMEKVSAKENE